MVLQPNDLQADTDSVGPSPKRIHPDSPGGAISVKFASVATAADLPIGTPVAWNDDLEMYQAWNPNTGLPADVNEVQEITFDAGVDGGTFILAFKGEETAPIAYNANAATIETAFEGLATVGAGNGTVTGGALPGTPVVITFTGALAGAPQELVVLNDGGLLDGAAAAGGIVTRVTPGVAGGAADEVITIDEASGTVTAGTFTITFNGETTDPIDWDASAADVLAAVLALDNVPAGAFTAAGGALPGTAVVLTAAGAFVDADLPEMFVDSSGLTGGTISAVVTTDGTSAEGESAPAGVIAGFVYGHDVELSEDGEVFGTVMFKGQIHRDDIELPTVGSPTDAQLDEALRDGLIAKGLIIQGLTGIH